jgi:serine protease SohB
MFFGPFGGARRQTLLPLTEGLLVEATKLRTRGTKPVAVIDYPCAARNPVAVYGYDIDFVIANREQLSGVVIRVSSPGGLVMEYGYLYEQTRRLRSAGIPVTAIIDQVGASGGYLMVLPAEKIIVGELSLIGSVGVVSLVINVHDALQRWGVRPFEVTAGEYKRTLSPFSEVTPEKERAFAEELAQIHDAFRHIVTEWRPSVDEALLNGRAWIGRQAVEAKLADEVGNSNEYLLKLNESTPLLYIHTVEPGSRGLASLLRASVSYVLEPILSRLEVMVRRVLSGNAADTWMR